VPATRRHRAPALVRALVVALVVGALVAGAGPTAAAAGDGDVSWGVRTADDALGSGRENYEYAIDPGGAVQDAMVVTNHADAPIELDVYAADAFTTDSGELGALTRDDESTGVGAWLAPDTDHVSVAAGASVEVRFTVDVPAGATPGDRAGAILTSLTTAGQQGVDVERRLGIRVHLRVGGDVAPRLVVENLRVAYAGTPNPFGTGEATLSYTVRNVGNIRLGAGQVASVSGPFGWFGVRAGGLADVPELLPGESWDVTVPIARAVPAFRLQARVTLDPIRPDESIPALGPVEGTAAAWAVPWSPLALVVLVAVGIWAALALRRRGRARRAAAQEARVREAVRQALRARGVDA
jgi:hypothetical protein